MSGEIDGLFLMVVELLGPAEQSAADRLQSLKAMLDGPGRERALQAISSPTLGTESLAAAKRRADDVMLTTIKESEKPAAAGLQALLKMYLVRLRRDLVHEALGPYQAGEDAEGARHPTRRSRRGEGVPPELAAFGRAMEARGVTASMFDQLRGPELDLYAEGFRDKVRDYRHQDSTGFWTRLTRAGMIDVPVEGLSPDERETVSIALSRVTPEETIARRFLEELAGRPLAISGQFALALLCRYLSGHDHDHGLRLTGDKIDTAELVADTDLIMSSLGIGADDFARLWAVRGPDIRERFAAFSEQDDERREAEQRSLQPLLAIARDYLQRREGKPTGPKIPSVGKDGENLEQAMDAARVLDMFDAVEERDAQALASLLRRSPCFRHWFRREGYAFPDHEDDPPDELEGAELESDTEVEGAEPKAHAEIEDDAEQDPGDAAPLPAPQTSPRMEVLPAPSPAALPSQPSLLDRIQRGFGDDA